MDGSKASPLTEEDKLLFVAILDEDFHIPALKVNVVLVEMDIMNEPMKYEVVLEFPPVKDVQELLKRIR
ncbi:MAG: hypothetical protein FWC16_08255 [Defluviitaleaceae bacterium]|nr:hypothetical protein [Defluviitaleaceae bacterium]